jgi:hypothetical protein
MATARRLRGALCVAVLLGGAAPGVACAPYRPPFTAPAGAGSPADPHQATLVFLWPATSCDPAGYFTIAGTDGRFVGNVARGTQLRVSVPAGEHTFVAWNEVMEGASGAPSVATVPVLRATLAEGRVYYVRMAFGEWDATGPRHPFTWVRGGGSTSNRCVAVAPGESTTSAMVALPPGSEAWSTVPEWTAQLEVIAPDLVAGQAWLDANREVLDAHRAVGEGRFEGLRPGARRMATVVAEDGVSGR